MYKWLIFLHIAGTLGFMMAHGASASVAFALRRERNLERVRALLELSANSYGLMYLSLLVLLVSGIVAGFIGQWWGHGWIWTSLALLVAISVAMTVLGSGIYGGARKATGLPYFENGKQNPPLESASAEEIEALLAKGNPILLTVIGSGGLLLILWLMMFKPF
ncbi:MAG: hypothetical protein AAB217_22035 [Chloroflexota bacterium]